MRQWIVVSLLALLPVTGFAQPARTPTDLDRLMDEVVRRRDDNWKKLQQYILTEMGGLLVDDPRLSADQLTKLLSAKGKALPGG